MSYEFISIDKSESGELWTNLLGIVQLIRHQRGELGRRQVLQLVREVLCGDGQLKELLSTARGLAGEPLDDLQPTQLSRRDQ